MREIELFKVGAPRATPSRAAAFQTPLGAIDLSVSADGIRCGDLAPLVYNVATHAHVLVWDAPALRAELLLAPLPADLPEGETVEAGEAAVWRVRATEPVLACAFEARWRDGRAPAAGGVDGGEGLVALTWEHEGLELSLGAPNAESLAFHERAGTIMPEAWHTLMAVDDPSSVFIEEYSPDGLRLQLPGLRAGEVAQLHMAVAWAERTEEPSTWRAVNVGRVSLAQVIASVV